MNLRVSPSLRSVLLFEPEIGPVLGAVDELDDQRPAGAGPGLVRLPDDVVPATLWIVAYLPETLLLLSPSVPAITP